ncbi:MAG: DUF3794 domain-containing protein [Ruminococcus sp.]|nr:DUF3794 domain-containing protein [Ruminococcus sp.]
MEFKTNREIIPTSEKIYCGIQEQAVELDYILPDYYPDIFRLVRCELTPVITGHTVIGDKLTYELRCDIRILYCGEDGSVLQSVEQRQSFQKTAELGSNVEAPEVTILPKTDHVNFRAVNKRRLDMRGAVSVRITVRGEKNQEALSDAFGMNVQLKKTPVRFAAKKLNAEKTVQLAEDIEFSPAQPDAANVVNIRCRPSQCEKKIISGKLLAKGDIAVQLLYSCENGGIEPMEFTLSYSQIVDMDGLDDTCDCTVSAEVTACSAAPNNDSDERVMRCEIEVRLVCTAVKTSSLMLITDAFSTIYPCELTTADISAEQIPYRSRESFRHSAVLAVGENVPQNIYSMWVTPKNINTHMGEDGKTLVISGMLTYSMAAKDAQGTIVIPDKDEAFEQTIALDCGTEGCTVTADISAENVSYNITDSGELTAKADISADITVSSDDTVRVVTDIAIDDSTRKQRDGDYAIKLYFAVDNEDIWDIAKRYSTDVSAVMEENELSGERLESGGMLLIPIVT